MHQSREQQKLANIERIMLANPDSAYTLLQKDSASICEMGKMHYQITLCRINDMLYKPHTSDSMMLKVADYFEKRNNKVLLSQAYYCLGVSIEILTITQKQSTIS